MRYHIWTVGCQMNKSDSERCASALEALGLRSTDDLRQADVVVFNTCSVRESAEQRVIGRLGMLKALKRQGYAPFVVLAGCMVGADTTALKKRLPQVDAFVKPSDVDAVVAAVREHYGAVLDEAARSEHVTDFQSVGLRPESAVARWVPIIYGCDNFCSYCIVPFRRGRERSRPVDEIVAEVRAFVAEGAKEVTLLGQNVDSYGQNLPGKPDLADLLAELNDVAGLERIRFLTSHPKDMSERLIAAVATLPKVCEHINLPVQHGDDDILRAMRRGYTADQYRDLVRRLRAKVPNVSLSTDVIVGFPGETTEQFNRTYELLEELRYDVVHVAAYSPRPGTRAAQMPDDVPADEKKRRLSMVELLQERIALESNQALVGSMVEVLVETLRKGKWEGRTRTNKLVFLSDSRDLRGQFVTARVETATAWALQGVLQEAGVPCS